MIRWSQAGIGLVSEVRDGTQSFSSGQLAAAL